MNIRGYGQDSDDVLVVVEKGHGMTVHTMEHLAVMFGPGKDDRRVFEDAGRHSRNARDIEPEGHTFFGGSDVLSGYGSVLVDDDAVAAHKDYITKVAIFWDDEGRDGITDQSDEPGCLLPHLAELRLREYAVDWRFGAHVALAASHPCSHDKIAYGGFIGLFSALKIAPSICKVLLIHIDLPNCLQDEKHKESVMRQWRGDVLSRNIMPEVIWRWNS